MKEYTNIAKDAQQFGKRLKTIREKFFDQTQQELASLIGITQAHVCNVEKGRDLPSIDVLFKLSRIVRHEKKISMHWLTTGEGKRYLQSNGNEIDNELLNKINQLDERKRAALISLLDIDLSEH